MFKKDKIYLDTINEVVDFSFDEKIAQVFPDMLHRSIPGYALLLTTMQTVFSYHFKNFNKENITEKNIQIYDLGCSVGGVILALSKVLNQASFIGIDNSKQMLEQCEKAMNIAKINTFNLQEADLSKVKLQPTDAIIINYTLQFLEKKERQILLDKCYKSLKPNGILFISEKTKETKEIINWHEQFKLNNGYSELEVAQKRTAIENVMQIDDEQTILQRFKNSGFKENNITQVFHSLSFKAWVCIK